MSRVNLYVKFPEMWRITLNARPATAADWKVAVELLNRAKFSPGGKVRLTSHACAKIGISRHTRLRSLNRLGSWGLIHFQSRQKASPLITVKWLAGRQLSDA
jgi:hypothetical protein